MIQEYIPTSNHGPHHQDVALLRVLEKFETTSRVLLPKLDNVQLGKELRSHDVCALFESCMKMDVKMFTAPLKL